MKINGVELEVNFLDADFMEKIENCCRKVSEQAEKSKTELKNLTLSQQIKGECKIIKDFFDEVFGEGTSDKVFKGKNDLKLCLSAFQDLIEAKAKMQQEMNSLFAKYSPDRLK